MKKPARRRAWITCAKSGHQDYWYHLAVKKNAKGMDQRIDRFAFANDLRGPAALTVLVGHFLHNAWYMRPLVDTFASVDMAKESAVPTPVLMQWLSAIPNFDWGAFGVALFFLVSGFVIPISLKRYSVPGFLVGRVFRIWPTYIAGFTVTIAAIYLAGLHFGRPFPYAAKEIAIHYVPGLRDLLWSTNIDGVIWTLEIELKFYAVCAAAAFLIRRESVWLFSIPVGIAVACLLMTGYLDTHGTTTRVSQVAAALTLSGQFIAYMFIGTAVAFAMNRSISGRAAVLIAGSLATLFVWTAVEGPWRGINLPLAAYVSALAVFLLAAWLWRPQRSPALLLFLANISYPLYASHIAVGYVLIAVVLQSGGSPALAVATAMAAVILIAWVIHRCVEAPTHRIGQRFARIWTRTSPCGQTRAPNVPTAGL